MEDDNYVLAEEPIFGCAATSVHDTHSQVGEDGHEQSSPLKHLAVVFSPFMDVRCVWLLVCQLQIPVDHHSQMVGELAAMRL